MMPDFRSERRHARQWPSMRWRGRTRTIVRLPIVLCLLCLSARLAPGQDAGTIDPSGVWSNPEGSLSLMLAGDALSFSYAAVFGTNAHLCSGAGVAGLEQANTYHYMDESGTVAFDIARDTIRMRMVDGVPSFCGSGWTGVLFTRDGFAPADTVRVRSRKARFYVVMPSPPWERKGFVVTGDRIAYVPTQHDDAADYVLARYRGRRATTVGLLLKRDLTFKK